MRILTGAGVAGRLGHVQTRSPAALSCGVPLTGDAIPAARGARDRACVVVSLGFAHLSGPGGDVVAGGQGVGVVGAEDPLLVGQQLPGQAQRLPRIPAPARGSARSVAMAADLLLRV